jgi:hypothetical protein
LSIGPAIHLSGVVFDGFTLSNLVQLIGNGLATSRAFARPV